MGPVSYSRNSKTPPLSALRQRLARLFVLAKLENRTLLYISPLLTSKGAAVVGVGPAEKVHLILCRSLDPDTQTADDLLWEQAGCPFLWCAPSLPLPSSLDFQLIF